MRRGRSYRFARFVSAVLVAALTAATLVISEPAAASVSQYHGKWAGQVSGCKANFRIGETARLVTDAGKDFGWIEWRASRTGNCAGYQWVRVHLSRDFGCRKNESSHKGWTVYYKTDAWGNKGVRSSHKYNKKVKGARYLKKGAYNSRIFYAPSAKACAELYMFHSPKSVQIVQIKGQGSLPKLTYCA